MKSYTVIQVARRTGISVRTLHHYEAQGLLLPAQRSDKGYRLYGVAELQRLHHVLALKSVGFSLAEIRQCLAADAPSFDAALRQQVVRLREVVLRQGKLLARLEAVMNTVESGRMIEAETLLSSIGASTMIEKYLTDDQRAVLHQRGKDIGTERIREIKEAWPPLISAFRAALVEKKDPASEEVQTLAHRWRELVREFEPPAEDAELRAALKNVWKNEPAMLASRTGVDIEVFQYARRALEASR